MKIDNRQRVLAIFAGVAVALFAADKVLITPLTKSWKTRADRLNTLAKQVADGRGLLQRQQGLRNRWDQMRTNTLPINQSLAEQTVLKSFDRWSQESRISIVSISPQWKRDADEFMTLECRVEAAGTLDRLSRFLYNLEKDPLGLKIQMVELSSRDNEGAQLALGLQVSALMLTPPEAGAVAPVRRAGGK